MYFEFDDDQEEFRKSLRRLLTERAPMSRVREFAESGDYDADTWNLLASNMGVPGLHIDEQFGGGGFTFLETCLVAQELGRALTPVPMVTTTGAIEAILRLGTDQQKQDLLPRLVEGSAIGALALSGPDDTSVDVAGVRAVDDGPGAQSLTGRVDYVAFGHIADLFVVPALTPAGDQVALYAVDANADGVEVTSQPSLDLTRPVATVEFTNTPAQLLGAEPEPIRHVVDVVRTLLANESLGAAEAALEMAVEYAKQRVQFNRPIGSFQAIKHKCADMAIAIDALQATVMYASMCADQDSDEFSRVSVMAKGQAAECLTLCASQNIQVHGGIGFTWEADPHLYFRRAKATEPLFGNSKHHSDLLADLVGI
ncbi:acyl-CoA/acyl-ACP dehydrogenase [Gordonia sp. HY285]|uniref:Acyl-CoA/acyl-ACP dehydrogenase n=1 Tax=Gordonia liuliyuniae TaxID=2911517 RepID=A0ABS9ITR9_9ACTN|nr:acyl-CoA dehydrogenase family protein [Gordonia liuliyuniae]MCF8588948.1 acyl-CoA/acyl-ACP dehydrogenase [Gordonia liuliyuniae]MCF8609171.1 acyl-CoA/acyl-ACP dehydrogenase [Gordonia liuliyuniae]